ncbi:Hsp20/alpha crystallin family protein [Patescibacteria group bacterium]|nr:Hsp20/alpha crystallin family protein [Patescibacteria group bacterium]
MTDFFEKLKKGMDVEELPEEESSVVLAAAKTKPEKRKKPVNPARDYKGKEETPRKKISNGVKKAKKIEIKKEKTEKKKIETGKEKKWFEPEGQLTIDVYQTDKEIIIQSAIAGIEPEDLDITIENDLVIIRGNRERKFTEEKKNYFYQECYWGRFSREIILPAEVDSSRAEATIENGILTIRIPKIEREKKRKIAVRE